MNDSSMAEPVWRRVARAQVGVFRQQWQLCELRGGCNQSGGILTLPTTISFGKKWRKYPKCCFWGAFEKFGGGLPHADFIPRHILHLRSFCGRLSDFSSACTAGNNPQGGCRISGRCIDWPLGTSSNPATAKNAPDGPPPPARKLPQQTLTRTVRRVLDASR